MLCISQRLPAEGTWLEWGLVPLFLPAPHKPHKIQGTSLNLNFRYKQIFFSLSMSQILHTIQLH